MNVQTIHIVMSVGVNGLTKFREVISGNKVTKSGYYVYFSHLNPDHFNDCFIAEKAKTGLYLAKGSFAPDLGSCLHQIIWRYVDE